MYHKSTSYRMFTIANTIFMVVIAALCILPLIHVVAVSLSDKSAVSGNLVNFWPKGFNIDAYAKTIQNHIFVLSLWTSSKRVILGTLVSMGAIILAAYPLSKEASRLRGRSFFSWYFVFTMLFSGGLVPTYIIMVQLNLINSIWSLVLPGAVNVFNLILMMNFYRNVPKELEEAAMIDGASHWVTLWKVYLPLSMPAIATLSLFTIVTHWNSWFDGLIYMTRKENYPLATYLHTIVVQVNLKDLITNVKDVEQLTERSIRAAQIVVSVIPVLVLYPFLQRHFVKGIVLGAVKG